MLDTSINDRAFADVALALFVEWVAAGLIPASLTAMEPLP